MRKPAKKPWAARASSAVFALIGVAAVAFVIGHGFSAQASDTAQVEHLALQVKQATAQIQHERFRNVRDACVDANHRHARATSRLTVRADAAKRKTPARTAQIDASAAAFKDIIIDSLAPAHKDCAAFARSQVDAGS